jgi:parallel beta-helix repeat protein
MEHQLRGLKNQMERQLTMPPLEIIHVSSDYPYNDSDGTEDRPYKNIRDAVAAYDSQGVIHVYSGYYKESLVFLGQDSKFEKLVIKGDNHTWPTKSPSDFPKVYGNHNGSVFLFESCNYVHISNFIISGGANYDFAAGIKMHDCGYGVVEHNLISDCQVGIYFESCHDSQTIKCNSIKTVGGLQKTKYGILLEYCTKNDVYDNLVQTKNYGILLQNTDKCRISHNNLSGNSQAPIYIDSFPVNPTTISLGGNRIYNNNIDVPNSSSCKQIFQYLNYWDSNFWGFFNQDGTPKDVYWGYVSFPWIVDWNPTGRQYIPDPFP